MSENGTDLIPCIPMFVDGSSSKPALAKEPASIRARRGRRPKSTTQEREVKRRRTSATDFVRVKAAKFEPLIAMKQPAVSNTHESSESDQPADGFVTLLESEEEEDSFYDNFRPGPRKQKNLEKTVKPKSSYSPLRSFAGASEASRPDSENAFRGLIVQRSSANSKVPKPSRALTDHEEDSNFSLDPDFDDGFDPDREIRRIMSANNAESNGSSRQPAVSPSKKLSAPRKLFDLSSPVKSGFNSVKKSFAAPSSRDASPKSSVASEELNSRKSRSPSLPISSFNQKPQSLDAEAVDSESITTVQLEIPDATAIQGSDMMSSKSTSSRKRAHTPPADAEIIAESPSRSRVKAPIPAHAKTDMQNVVDLGEIMNFPFTYTSQQALPIL